MPIVFEEISGEIAPERATESAQPGGSSPAQDFDPAELLRRELVLMRERQQRAIAD